MAIDFSHGTYLRYAGPDQRLSFDAEAKQKNLGKSGKEIYKGGGTKCVF